MITLDVECYVNGTKDYIDKSIHIIMPIDEIDEEMVKTKDLEIETNHMHIHEHEDGTKHSHEHTHYDDIEDHFHEHEEKKDNNIDNICSTTSPRAAAQTSTASEKISLLYPNSLVVGADQILECEGIIFDKPKKLTSSSVTFSKISFIFIWFI